MQPFFVEFKTIKKTVQCTIVFITLKLIQNVNNKSIQICHKHNDYYNCIEGYIPAL